MSNNNQKKILVVDDEKMNIMALAQFLKPLYNIIIATDGASALETASKQIPDLILLDILMPDMNGFDVLVKLKDNINTMNIPVIFLTGLNKPTDEEKGLSLGAVDYITKPFNQTIVKARIKTHLKMSDYIKTIEKFCLIDALTGLSNKRGIEQRIDAEWGRAIREKRSLGFIIIDIDNFRKYNETYGHPQGDSLLQIMADTLVKSVNRSSDLTARWGGEEFLILLPDTNISGTVKIAEQIRKNITNMSIPCAGNQQTSVTVSLGALSKIPGEKDSLAGFISEIEKLLTKAKENGKNQTCSE